MLARVGKGQHAVAVAGQVVQLRREAERQDGGGCFAQCSVFASEGLR